MMNALGGSLTHEKAGGGPRGGTWVLTLDEKELRIPSEQAMTFPDLDACYHVKPGVVTPRTWEDRSGIDPRGLAKLFAKLGS